MSAEHGQSGVLARRRNHHDAVSFVPCRPANGVGEIRYPIENVRADGKAIVNAVTYGTFFGNRVDF